MKRLLLLPILGLAFLGTAYAGATVMLDNTTFQHAGEIDVKYQMLCQHEGETPYVCGEETKATLSPSKQVSISDEHVGIRVIALRYPLIKTPDHWFTLPTSDQKKICQVVVKPNETATIRLSATEHSIKCSSQ